MIKGDERESALEIQQQEFHEVVTKQTDQHRKKAKIQRQRKLNNHDNHFTVAKSKSIAVTSSAPKKNQKGIPWPGGFLSSQTKRRGLSRKLQKTLEQTAITNTLPTLGHGLIKRVRSARHKNGLPRYE